MKILLTGASGFIGTNLLLYLVDKGHQLLNLDLEQPKDKSFIKYWHKVDINNYDLFESEIMNFSPDYIVHLAARTDLDGKTLEEYSQNIEGVANILKIIKKLSSLKKIIITSSMYVCQPGYSPNNQFDYKPHTVYGKSKVMTEKVTWDNQPSCDWLIIRPTSIWGPWFGVPYRNFFDIVMSRLYFHIGNRSCCKTYGYIDNAIYQIETLLFADTINSENKMFYIGDTPATNIEEWANEIAAELGFKIIKLPYFILKLVAYVGDILGLLGVKFPMTSFRLNNMTTDNVVDISKTNALAPEVPYSRIYGVKKTLKWIKENS